MRDPPDLWGSASCIAMNGNGGKSDDAFWSRGHWTAGRNVHIKVRPTGTDAERIQNLVKELVALQDSMMSRY